MTKMQKNSIRQEIIKMLKKNGQMSLAQIRKKLAERGIIVDGLFMMRVMGSMNKIDRKMT
jgi:hypothetical protein